MHDTSFLSKPMRPIVAMLITGAVLIGFGFAADNHVRAVVQEVSAPAREVTQEQMAEVLRRLDRIERKLDQGR